MRMACMQFEDWTVWSVFNNLLENSRSAPPLQHNVVDLACYEHEGGSLALVNEDQYVYYQ